MKKALIVIGLLLLAGLGFCGYVVYRVAPHFQEAIERQEASERDLAALDEQYPLEPGDRTALDPDRFASIFPVRTEVNRAFELWAIDMEDLQDRAEREELGFFEQVEVVAGGFLPPVEVVPVNLEGIAMGPTEFRYHNQVLWAALRSIAGGAGGDDLQELGGCYAQLESGFNEIRQETRDDAGDRDLHSLDELIGTFDDELLSAARATLATVGPSNVLASIGRNEFELYFLDGGLELISEETLNAIDEPREEKTLRIRIEEEASSSESER